MLWFSYRILITHILLRYHRLGCFMFIHGVILYRDTPILLVWFILLICLFGDIIKRGRKNYHFMGEFEFWGSFKIWLMLIIYWYLCLSHFKLDTSLGIFLYLMCVGTTLMISELHTLMRKDLRFLNIWRTNDEDYSFVPFPVLGSWEGRFV